MSTARGVGAEREAAPRAPAVPPLVLLALLAVSGALAIRWLTTSVTRAGFAEVDTRRSVVATHPQEGRIARWIDERWRTDLSRRLAELADVLVSDRHRIELLAAEVAAAPYVAEVGAVNVVWPDGLELDVRFRRPVACVLRNGTFWSVAEDGVLLPGGWSSPPEGEGGCYLPRVVESSRGADSLRPGERFADYAALDGLAAALSMERSLSEADRLFLGRISIDARRAREASVQIPGTVIDLEGRRRVFFGRSPAERAAGEVPTASKWRTLSRCLEEIRLGRDWSLLDLRWDRPTVWERAAARQSADGRASRAEGRAAEALR